jgi:hypothetical protein
MDLPLMSRLIVGGSLRAFYEAPFGIKGDGAGSIIRRIFIIFDAANIYCQFCRMT